jgi:NAD(P)-dependent dehydrogenase (short-subunit alcohol dehydrogenase family)
LIETKGLRAVYEETFAINVFGAAVTAESFLPLLKKSKVGGRIVNVGSGAGSLGRMSVKNWSSENFSLLVCIVAGSSVY